MSTNPFSTRERQHFPSFSPMFHRTPASAEGNNSFRWSIDNIARLKPAEIATDAANLVQTNGHSPDDDHEAQAATDNFFSQKTILPSPWPVTRHQPKKALKPLDTTPEDSRPVHMKKVTFSPLPPTTAFIRNDSLVESDIRDSGTVDAGTQTVLTFPMNFDLEKLILQASMAAGALPAFPESSEEGEGKDSGNLSLRRKLFGQPDRQESSLSPSPTMVTDNIPLSELSPSTFDPTEVTSPSQFLQSPPLIYVTEGTGGGSKEQHNPAFSSLVLKSPMKDLPGFSPIGDQTNSSEDCGSMAARLMPDLSPIRPDHQNTPSNVAVGLFPATPKSKAGLPGSKRNLATAVTPIGVLPGQHLTCRTTPMAETKATTSDRGSTCTSTPNAAVTKRQLLASPFASPVLKHPCTKRTDIDNSVIDDINEKIHHDITDNPPIKIENDSPSSEHESSEEMAEPLSLDDLRTETLELTNITATSCTGYFTNLELDDVGHVATEIQGHTHQSMKGSVSSSSEWPPHHPKAHSTMVDSQHRPHTHIPTDISGPHVRGLSQIPITSQTSLTGLDSGVAGSVELHPSVSMFNSKLVSEKGQIEVASGLSQDGGKKEEMSGSGKMEENGGGGELKTPVHVRQLSVIGEGVGGGCDLVDSGLVFSPDPPTHSPLDDGESAGRGVTSHKSHPHFYTPHPHHTSHSTFNNHKHTHQSVLPSRLQVRTSTTSLLPLSNPSPGHYTLQSPVAKYCNTPVTKYSNTSKVTSPIGQLLHETPPSRFRCTASLSHLSAHDVLPDDVLKKKKALKARLQFKSGSGYHRDTMRDLTPHPMHSRISTRPAVPPRPRSPLTGITNRGYSHTILSPIHSPFLGNTSSTTPTSAWKSPWQPSSPLNKENIDVGWRTHAKSGFS